MERNEIKKSNSEIIVPTGNHDLKTQGSHKSC